MRSKRARPPANVFKRFVHRCSRRSSAVLFLVATFSPVAYCGVAVPAGPRCGLRTGPRGSLRTPGWISSSEGTACCGRSRDRATPYSPSRIAKLTILLSKQRRTGAFTGSLVSPLDPRKARLDALEAGGERGRADVPAGSDATYMIAGAAETQAPCQACACPGKKPGFQPFPCSLGGNPAGRAISTGAR